MNMCSAEKDTVLDSFLGFGTTSIACMLAKRNSIGYEMDPEVASGALNNMNIPVDTANEYIRARVNRHLEFINSLSVEDREKCYRNEPMDSTLKLVRKLR